MSVSPLAEKFNTVSNNHGLMQKCNFCVCLKDKTHCFCRFCPASSGIWSKKYFTEHFTLNTMHGFGDPLLVCKMHGCYCRIRKHFEQHFIPYQMQAITIDRLARCKTTNSKCYSTYLALHTLIQIVQCIDYSISQKYEFIRMNLWMVYICNVKSSGKYNTKRREEGECTEAAFQGCS